MLPTLASLSKKRTSYIYLFIENKPVDVK